MPEVVSHDKRWPDELLIKIMRLFFILFLPPTSVVDVIESVPFVCLFVCLGVCHLVSTLAAKPRMGHRISGFLPKNLGAKII